MHHKRLVAGPSGTPYRKRPPVLLSRWRYWHGHVDGVSWRAQFCSLSARSMEQFTTRPTRQQSVSEQFPTETRNASLEATTNIMRADVAFPWFRGRDTINPRSTDLVLLSKL